MIEVCGGQSRCESLEAGQNDLVQLLWHDEKSASFGAFCGIFHSTPPSDGPKQIRPEPSSSLQRGRTEPA